MLLKPGTGEIVDGLVKTIDLEDGHVCNFIENPLPCINFSHTFRGLVKPKDDEVNSCILMEQRKSNFL